MTKRYEDYTREQLLEEIKKLNKQKKFGLVWEDKPEQDVEDCKNNFPVLTEVSDKAISEAENSPTHLIIEGDNFHSLSVLNVTHKGKIDVIYIDPPYNTGKADEWKYNDKFVDENDSFRHSKWLSFIAKRLELAKNLLSENGTIFISIDDNEVAQLKVLCNEIFGENNFVGQWHWFKSATPPNLSLKIKKNVEFVLAYEKEKNNTRYKGVKKISSSDDPFTKPQNTIKQLTFPAKSSNFKIENCIIESGIYGTAKFPNTLLNDVVVENFTNKNDATFENRFIWTQEKLNEELAKNTIVNCSKTKVLSYKKQNYSEEVPPNLIDESVGVSTTEEAGKELTAMFGEKVFDYPKPISLIKYLLKFKDNITILDFFAGSGTTGHAVMQLNAEDGGNRKFILCQIDEPIKADKPAYKFCIENNLPPVISSITIERIKRAGEKIAKEIKWESIKLKKIAEILAGMKNYSGARLAAKLPPELLDGFNELYLRAMEDQSEAEERKRERDKILKQLEEIHLKEKLKKLSGIIAHLEASKKEKKIVKIEAEYAQTLKRLAELQRA